MSEATLAEPACSRALGFLEATSLLAARATCREVRPLAEHCATTCVSDSLDPALPLPAAGISTSCWLRALVQLHAPPLLVAVGGYNSEWNGHRAILQAADNGGCENSAEVVCSLQGGAPSERWRCSLPEMLTHRADTSIVRGGERRVLYALGGRCGEVRHSSVEKLDLVRWQLEGVGWCPVTPMLHERSGLVSGVLQNRLIVTGGRSARGVLREAEVLSLDTALGEGAAVSEAGWEPLRPMSEPREYAAGAALGGEFWVLGGGEFEGGSSVEVFDFGSGSWVAGPRMAARRYGAGAVAHEGRIHVIGGSSHFAQGRVLATLESLDPREGVWQLRPLNAPRRRHGFEASLWGCGVAAFENSLLLCGGTFREAEESQDTVRIVDLRTMEVTTSTAMRVPRWCGGACLL